MAAAVTFVEASTFTSFARKPTEAACTVGPLAEVFVGPEA
jgi:hypothetical protein